MEIKNEELASAGMFGSTRVAAFCYDSALKRNSHCAASCKSVSCVCLIVSYSTFYGMMVGHSHQLCRSRVPQQLQVWVQEPCGRQGLLLLVLQVQLRLLRLGPQSPAPQCLLVQGPEAPPPP